MADSRPIAGWRFTRTTGERTLKSLVVMNAKGGTGKTNVSLHLAHGLAEAHRVLVVDLDPQQAALSEPMAAYASDVPAAALFAETTEVKPVGRITLVPRSEHLAGIERENLDEMARNLLASLRASAAHYDRIVFDTPPHHGNSIAGAILAADLIVSPIELQEASLNAVESAVGTIFGVCDHFGKPRPDLTRKRPLLVSRFNRHSARQRGLFQDLAQQVGRIVIDGAVVARDAYARAHAEARPVWDLRDHRGQVSAAIKEAAAEMRGVLAQCEQMMEAS